MVAHYTVGGLGIRSDLVLPSLPATAPEDVRILVSDGHPAPRLRAPLRQGSNWQIGRGEWMIAEGGGCLYLDGGHTLTLWGPTAQARAHIGGFVRHAAFSAIFLHHDRVPLHAAALALGGGAILLLGQSGAGKSTLAAAFGRIGADLIADDLCAPLTVGGCVSVHPVFLANRLLPDAAQALGLEGVPSPDGKLELPPRPGLAPGPVPVRALILLAGRDPGPGRVELLAPAQVLPRLVPYVPTLRVAAELTGRADTLARLGTLAQVVPAFAVHPPDRIAALPGHAASLARMAGLA
ncbi:hypothetical protein [Zavarzinia sp. CC-PAN008]|uniref:hypothetical protein n=1 Tax=Zavarzinia sp. CC-PAN008 TaxID=3243332 RepID=UPI003F748810